MFRPEAEKTADTNLVIADIKKIPTSPTCLQLAFTQSTHFPICGLGVGGNSVGMHQLRLQGRQLSLLGEEILINI